MLGLWHACFNGFHDKGHKYEVRFESLTVFSLYDNVYNYTDNCHKYEVRKTFESLLKVGWWPQIQGQTTCQSVRKLYSLKVYNVPVLQKKTFVKFIKLGK